MRWNRAHSIGTILLVFAVCVVALRAAPQQSRIRSGTMTGSFYYWANYSDASDYYSANGYFQSTEDYDGNGTPAVQVYWGSYDSKTGASEYAYGYAPPSAVKAQGTRIAIDVDVNTMLQVLGSSGPTSWRGTFTPYEKGPMSHTQVTNGYRATHDEYYCVVEQQVTGSTIEGTSNFVGTCGGVEVPGPTIYSFSNGNERIFRGTGWMITRCPPFP